MALAEDLVAKGDLALAAALTELAQRRQLKAAKGVDGVDSTYGVDSAEVIASAKLAAAAATRRQLWHPDGANPSPLPWGNRSGPTPDCVFDCDNWESELDGAPRTRLTLTPNLKPNLKPNSRPDPNPHIHLHPHPHPHPRSAAAAATELAAGAAAAKLPTGVSGH